MSSDKNEYICNDTNNVFSALIIAQITGGHQV